MLNAPRYSSICGHVTDTHGDTHRSLRIWYRSSINQNSYQQIKEVGADNDGYFRIDELLAGDYLLQTSINGRTFSLSRNLMLTDARPVLVEDGKDTGCKGTPPLEFYVPPSDGKTHTVSGSVAGEVPARIGDRFLVQLGDAENAAAYDPQQKKELDTDRKFHLDNVPNGRYRLNIYGVYGPEPAENETRFRVYSGPGFNVEPLRHLIVSQLIEVSDQDVTGLTLTQLTLPSVTGTVRIPPPPTVWKDFKMSDLSVKLVPHRKNGFLTASLTDKGNGRGEFAMDAADAGEYEVQLVSTSRSRNTSNIYIQSVRLNGEEVNPRFVNLPKDGVAALEIEVASEMSSVKAYVLPDKTFSLPVQPLLESCAIPGGNYDVVLFPDPLFSPNIGSEPEQGPHYFTAWSSGTTCREISHGATQYWDGGFRDLQPGKYFAIAVKDNRILDLGIFNQGQMSLEQRRLWSELTTITKPITLHSGENLDLTLEDKTIEAARIAARVGVTDEPEDLHSSNGKICCHR